MPEETLSGDILRFGFRSEDGAFAVVHLSTDLGLEFVAVSRPLAAPAALEALSLAAEARTAAILDAALQSRRSGAPATGTGTDCIVVAAPAEARGAAYAGKHTALGEAVGAAVYQAVLAGARRWKEAHACRV